MKDNQNFCAALIALGSKNPSAPFLRIPGARCWTYGEIINLSAKLATALLQTGAKPGDRVTVQVEKSAETIALYLATLRAGLVYTPLNTAYTPEETAYFLEDGEPKVFVTNSDRTQEFASLTKAHGITLRTLDADGGGNLLAAAHAAHPMEDIAIRHADDLAVILYTSGTTGRSKGAMLSHGNLASNATTLHQLWGFEPGDVLLHALPVFHIHGLFVAMHTSMLNGSEVIFLPSFTPSETLRALPQSTVFMGVPTFYTRLLSDSAFNEETCKNMRLFISGSAPLLAETHEAFQARSGHSILERYGMSEAGMIASNPLKGDRLPGTVGFALPGVDIRITDDKGTVAAPGVSGNVEVRGPNIFKGYWRMDQKTAESFQGDWFITGDIGSLAPDGRLTLSGRAKDLIIVGGYNVYPKEIEDVLNAVDGIEESAVIGVPHPDMGEGVAAIVVSQLNEDGISERITSAIKKLARFKQPRRIVFEETLPRNTMGKVQKQVLRERYNGLFAKRD